MKKLTEFQRKEINNYIWEHLAYWSVCNFFCIAAICFFKLVGLTLAILWVVYEVTNYVEFESEVLEDDEC